jgi:hypothetical protein
MHHKDIHLAAKLLIEHYGPNAAQQAAATLDALQRRDDAESAAGWRRVLQMILEIQGSGTKH